MELRRSGILIASAENFQNFEERGAHRAKLSLGSDVIIPESSLLTNCVSNKQLGVSFNNAQISSKLRGRADDARL